MVIQIHQLDIIHVIQQKEIIGDVNLDGNVAVADLILCKITWQNQKFLVKIKRMFQI